VIVLSDTSLIHYLVVIGEAEILHAIFGQVIVPSAVLNELQRSGAPEVVRLWVSDPPPWLLIRTPTQIDPTIQLGRGEIEAICLAVELHADVVLMDDRRGRRVAESHGLSVVGTVNVLEVAAERELLSLPVAIEKLRETNFHIAERILARALAADAERRNRRDS
jgi:predicted nucleic acid-binding protein